MRDFSHVNFWGLAVMLVGLGLHVLAPWFSRRFFEVRQPGAALALRFAGLAAVILGTLISMRII